MPLSNQSSLPTDNKRRADRSPSIPDIISAEIKRFPPVLQFLTHAEPVVEQQLRTIAMEAYVGHKDIDQICWEIYSRAGALGYEATIGVQEVTSASMPSFPGQKVVSSLLMIDLSKLEKVLN